MQMRPLRGGPKQVSYTKLKVKRMVLEFKEGLSKKARKVEIMVCKAM